MLVNSAHDGDGDSMLSTVIARARTSSVPLALALLVLAGTTSGCRSAPRIELVEQSGGDEATEAPFDWPRPVRVGVIDNGTRYPTLHDRVVSALAQGVDRVVPDVRRAHDDPVDYVVDLDIAIDSSAHATNFLVVFPGFVIFMPSWFPLRWDFEVTTSVRVSRGSRHGSKTFVLTDRFLAKYTPVGISVGAYIGWGGLVFPPLVISPLVTGLVAAADDWDPRSFAKVLARDAGAGARYAEHVAHAVKRAIDADLRFE